MSQKYGQNPGDSTGTKRPTKGYKTRHSDCGYGSPLSMIFAALMKGFHSLSKLIKIKDIALSRR